MATKNSTVTPAALSRVVREALEIARATAGEISQEGNYVTCINATSAINTALSDPERAHDVLLTAVSGITKSIMEDDWTVVQEHAFDKLRKQISTALSLMPPPAVATSTPLPLSVQTLIWAARTHAANAADVVTRQAMSFANHAMAEPDNAPDLLIAAVGEIDDVFSSPDCDPDDLVFYAKLRGLLTTALHILAPEGLTRLIANDTGRELAKVTAFAAEGFYRLAAATRASNNLLDNIADPSDPVAGDVGLLLSWIARDSDKLASAMDSAEVSWQECAA